MGKSFFMASHVCALFVLAVFFESFGLPLLEAKFLGLPILASELDYVRDVVEPTETFDPESPVSISRAVQRFLKISQSSKVKMLSTPEFLGFILNL